MPVFTKEILAPGTYYTRQGPVEFTPTDIEMFCATAKDMMRNGQGIPVPLEHQPGAKPVSLQERLANSVAFNTGWVKDVRVKDGILYGDLDISWLPGAFTDEDILLRLNKTIKYVSPELFPTFQTGDGRIYKHAMTHVALTPLPVCMGQRPFGDGDGGPAALSLSANPAKWWGRFAKQEAMYLSLGQLWHTKDPRLAKLVQFEDWQVSVEMAAAHAPPGGITIRGVFYPGGRFIPASEVAQAAPDVKQKLAASTEAKRVKLTGEVPTPDAHDVLRKKLSAHDDTHVHPTHMTNIRHWYQKAKEFYGPELLHHRIHRTIHQDLAKYEAAVKSGDKKEAANMAIRLKGLSHMVDWHERETKAKPYPPVKGNKTGTHTVDLDSLHIDPERFQYKLNTGASGVAKGGKLEGSKKFNQDFSGKLLVWHDPEANKDFVVNGHHRFAKAKELGEKQIDIKYIDAPDAQHARSIGALANIAEGNGTAVDAAKFMRDTHSTLEDMDKHGVSVSGAIARDGAILANLSAPLFQKLTTGGISEKEGLAIAKIPDHDSQSQFAAYLRKLNESGKGVSDRVMMQMSDLAASAPKVPGGKNMFGDDEEDQNLFLEKARLIDSVRQRLGQEKDIFKVVGGNAKKAEKIMATGKNKLDVEENKRVAQEAAEHHEAFSRLVRYAGPLAELSNRAAEELSRAKSEKQRKAITDKFYEAARAELAKPVSGRTEPSDEGSVPPPAAGQQQQPEPKPEEVAPRAWTTKFQPKPPVEPIAGRQAGDPEKVSVWQNISSGKKEQIGKKADEVVAGRKTEQVHSGVNEKIGGSPRIMRAADERVGSKANEHFGDRQMLERAPDEQVGRKADTLHDDSIDPPKSKDLGDFDLETSKRDRPLVQDLDETAEYRADKAKNVRNRIVNPGQAKPGEVPPPAGNESSREWWNKLSPEQRKLAAQGAKPSEKMPAKHKKAHAELADKVGSYDSHLGIGQTYIDNAFRAARTMAQIRALEDKPSKGVNIPGITDAPPEPPKSTGSVALPGQDIDKLRHISGRSPTRKDMQALGYRAMVKSSDLHSHGYNIVHWANPKQPGKEMIEYLPRDKGSKLPRMVAETPEQQKAVHDALGGVPFEFHDKSAKETPQDSVLKDLFGGDVKSKEPQGEQKDLFGKDAGQLARSNVDPRNDPHYDKYDDNTKKVLDAMSDYVQKSGRNIHLPGRLYEDTGLEHDEIAKSLDQLKRDGKIKETGQWPGDTGRYQYTGQASTATASPAAPQAPNPERDRLKNVHDIFRKQRDEAAAEFARSFPSGKRPEGSSGRGYDDRKKIIDDYDAKIADVRKELDSFGGDAATSPEKPAGSPSTSNDPFSGASTAAPSGTLSARAAKKLSDPSTPLADKLRYMGDIDTAAIDPIINNPELAAKSGLATNEYLRTVDGANKTWQKSLKAPGDQERYHKTLEKAQELINSHLVPGLEKLEGQKITNPATDEQIDTKQLADFYKTHAAALIAHMHSLVPGGPDAPSTDKPAEPKPASGSVADRLKAKLLGKSGKGTVSTPGESAFTMPDKPVSHPDPQKVDITKDPQPPAESSANPAQPSPVVKPKLPEKAEVALAKIRGKDKDVDEFADKVAGGAQPWTVMREILGRLHGVDYESGKGSEDDYYLRMQGTPVHDAYKELIASFGGQRKALAFYHPHMVSNSKLDIWGNPKKDKPDTATKDDLTSKILDAMKSADVRLGPGDFAAKFKAHPAAVRAVLDELEQKGRIDRRDDGTYKNSARGENPDPTADRDLPRVNRSRLKAMIAKANALAEKANKKANKPAGQLKEKKKPVAKKSTKKSTELSVWSKIFEKDVDGVRVAAKNNIAPLGTTAILLSQTQREDTHMAKEDMPFDTDEDEKPEEEGDEVGEMPDEEGGEEKGGDTGVASLLKEATAEASEMGIMVPDDASNPKEWIEHFITAVKTHKSTKNISGTEGGGEDKPSPPAPQEEPPAVSMSKTDPATDARVRVLEEGFADERYRSMSSIIDDLVAKGRTSPAKGKEWKDVLGVKKLSLIPGRDDVAVTKVLSQIDLAKDIPEQTFWTKEEKVARLSSKANQPEAHKEAGWTRDEGNVSSMSGDDVTKVIAEQFGASKK